MRQKAKWPLGIINVDAVEAFCGAFVNWAKVNIIYDAKAKVE